MTVVKVKKSILAEMIKRSVENKMNEDLGQPQQVQQPKQQRDLRNPKIQKLVDEINSLISKAVDSNNDPIGVIDNTSTWESPMVFQPIKYNLRGQLQISNSYPHEPRRGDDVEVINPRDMEFDGIPTLKNIRKMYVKTLKQIANQATVVPNVEECSINEGFEELLPVAAGTAGVFLASYGIPEVMNALEQGKLGPKGQKLAQFLQDLSRRANKQESYPQNNQNPTESMDEEGKPSAGLSNSQKSDIATKARHGEDIGKPGNGFEKVANKAAKEYGSKEAGEKVAASSMWKNAKR